MYIDTHTAYVCARLSTAYSFIWLLYRNLYASGGEGGPLAHHARGSLPIEQENRGRSYCGAWPRS